MPATLVPVPRDGNDWIIARDEDFHHAMVGTPDRRFLWILPREPRPDPDVYRYLKAEARCLDFDTGRLVSGDC